MSGGSDSTRASCRLPPTGPGCVAGASPPPPSIMDCGRSRGGSRAASPGSAPGSASPTTTLSWKRKARLGRWRRPRPGGRGMACSPTGRARHGIAVIALGHTRDDRIETFLMRARQGSGWHGLAGPLPSGPSPVWPEGRGLRLIRPLLAFGREDLRAELRQRAALPGSRILRTRPSGSNGCGCARWPGAWMRKPRRQALRVMDSLAQMRAAVLAEARLGLRSCRHGSRCSCSFARGC